MEGWQELVPFPDALPGLERLRGKFKLVVLSNGKNTFLAHLVKNRLKFDFDAVISVGEWRCSTRIARLSRCGRVLQAEPCELMMVSAHSFDVVGAHVSGYRAAYVNRYDLLFEETPYRFDVAARDFLDLADKLGCVNRITKVNQGEEENRQDRQE